MGVLPESLAQNHVQFFEPGDVLVIASDGIPEATLPDGSFLGYDAVEQLIQRHRKKSAEDIGKMLLEAAARQPVQDDDRTLIVIKRVK
jgi:serine phosphatase RsbU (regulator of sigma subunit)